MTYFLRFISSASGIGSSNLNLLVTGGLSSGGGTEIDVTSEIFSHGVWSEGPRLPDQRQNHCQVNLNGEIFIIGGRSGSSTAKTVYKTTESDLVFEPWIQVADMNEAREDHCSAAHKVCLKHTFRTIK